MTDFQQTPPDIAKPRPEDQAVVNHEEMKHTLFMLLAFVAGVGLYAVIKHAWFS